MDPDIAKVPELACRIAHSADGFRGPNFRNLRNFHRGTLNFRGANLGFFGISLSLEISTPVCESCETCESFWFAPIADKSGTELLIPATHAPSSRRSPTPLGGSSRQPARLPRSG